MNYFKYDFVNHCGKMSRESLAIVVTSIRAITDANKDPKASFRVDFAKGIQRN